MLYCMIWKYSPDWLISDQSAPMYELEVQYTDKSLTSLLHCMDWKYCTLINLWPVCSTVWTVSSPD